jgi:hypothetical protein
MTSKLLLLAFLPLAYGRQVAFVDLSRPVRRPDTGPGKPYPPHPEYLRGGGVVGHGAPKSPVPLPIRLVLTRIIPARAGIQVRYIAEVVMTSEGEAPISVPIGADADSLLASTQHNRRDLVFTAAFAKSGRGLAQSGATSASNSEHPESSASLERGDAAVFLVPLGNWSAEKAPPDAIIVSVQQKLKVVDGVTDWTEPVGPELRSENALPLPPAPDQTDIQ